MRAPLLFILLSFIAVGPAAIAQEAPLSYDARLSGYQYPFDVKMFPFYAQGQDLEMAYMFLKGDGKKPTVTLLHGKNFNGAYWEETARFLHGQGYSVLIPDQIGFGKSSKPPSYQFSFAALASNTRALMDKLNIEKTIIVGHSMGGMLATRFALLYPKATQQLVLINPIGLENYLNYAEYKGVDFFYETELNTDAEKIRAYQQSNYYNGMWNDRYAELIVPAVGQAQGPDRERVAWNSALTYDMIFTQPVVTEMGNLIVPTALLIGTRDRTGPGKEWMKQGVTYELGRYDRLGPQTAARIPNASYYPLEGLGHLPHIENFQKFKEAFQEALGSNMKFAGL